MSMSCPRCGSPEKQSVVDSRPYSQTIRRRRLCHDCDTTFTTYEVSAFDYRKVQQWIRHVAAIKRLAMDMLTAVESIDTSIERAAQNQVCLRDILPNERNEPLPLPPRESPS